MSLDHPGAESARSASVHGPIILIPDLRRRLLGRLPHCARGRVLEQDAPGAELLADRVRSAEVLGPAGLVALGGRGRNGAFDVGGPARMTFDDLIRLVMEITGRHRLIIHVPEAIMRLAGAAAEMLPVALFSRDAASFLLADNAGDIKPLVEEFGIKLTPAREGLAYLAPKK